MIFILIQVINAKFCNCDDNNNNKSKTAGKIFLHVYILRINDERNHFRFIFVFDERENYDDAPLIGLSI